MTTATSAPTSEQIDANISAMRDRIIALEIEADDLAYPAVSGDETAAKAYTRLQSQIRQTKAELSVLQKAKAAAATQEAAQERAKESGYRAHHHAIAKNRAAELVRTATRAEKLVADLKVTIADLDRIESAIWSALKEAAAPPSDSIVGRKGISQFAVAALTAFTNGIDRFQTPRSVSEVARIAWSSLLADEGASDD
jgi:hypothetical protein